MDLVESIFDDNFKVALLLLLLLDKLGFSLDGRTTNWQCKINQMGERMVVVMMVVVLVTASLVCTGVYGSSV